MLQSLALLKEMSIIHCDLKPENILFTDETKKSIKIIDFGSACTNKTSNFTYCQSRYYRCPEITLSLPFNQAADMWSLACILVEIVTGEPLFPAVDEHELMEYYMVRIGHPPE